MPALCPSVVTVDLLAGPWVRRGRRVEDAGDGTRIADCADPAVAERIRLLPELVTMLDRVHREFTPEYLDYATASEIGTELDELLGRLRVSSLPSG